jgi:hypothetical protein
VTSHNICKAMPAGSKPVEAKRQAREDATTKTFQALTDRAFRISSRDPGSAGSPQAATSSWIGMR